MRSRLLAAAASSVIATCMTPALVHAQDVTAGVPPTVIGTPGAPTSTDTGTPGTPASTAAPTSSAAPSITSSQAGLDNAPHSVEEIVVTAQKRQEKISDVGMAITAATGAQLLTRGIVNVQDLAKLEPSLQFTESNNGLPVYTIRGVGYYEQSLAAAPAVSLYLDEAPFAYAAETKGALLDVERVEILKGPQGTLYGQNATGGAINFVPAQPTRSFTAGLDAIYGRFNATTIDGFVSGPITDTLSVRLAARIDEGGAWQRSDTRSDSLGNKDFQTARAIVLWTPTSDFKAKIDINGFLDGSQTQAAQLEGFRLQSPGYVSHDPSGFVPNPVDYPFYPAQLKAQLANPVAPADDRAADWVAGTHPHDREHFLEGIARFDYDPLSYLGLTSITKYETFTEHDTQDIGALNVPEVTPHILGQVRSVSQELRAHGTFDERKFEWLGGLYYADDQAEENDAVAAYNTGTFLTGGAVGSPLSLGGPFNFFGSLHDSDTKTYSAFGNLTYHVLNNLDLHGGVRYTVTKEYDNTCSYFDSIGLYEFQAGLASELTGTPQPVQPLGACGEFLPNNTQGAYATNQVEHNVPWRVGVDWKPIRDNLIYASISRGFKAGGSPALGASSYIQLKPVVQEELTAYEAGFKSEFFDRSLQIDGSVFYYDYTNKQFLGRAEDPLGVFGALQTLVNIPKSKETGAELSGTWRPFQGLMLNAAVTYLDSTIVSNFQNYSPYITSATDTINFKGEAFPFTPKWAVSYGARYDRRINDGLSGFVSANASYQSRTVAAFGAAQAALVGPSFEIRSYGLLDLAAGVESADKHWKFQVWGKNVTNTYYWNNVFYEYDTTARYAGMPATYGVTVNYRY